MPNQIIKESVLKWTPIKSSGSRVDNLRLVQTTDVDLKDKRVIHIDGFNEEQVRLFKVIEGGVRPYEQDTRVHTAITYEIDMTKTTISRL